MNILFWKLIRKFSNNISHSLGISSVGPERALLYGPKQNVSFGSGGSGHALGSVHAKKWSLSQH